LTGKYRRGERGRATELKASVLHDDAQKNAPLLDTLFAIAEEVGAQPGHVAIAWVSAQGVIPVIGPRTSAQLEDNLRATSIRLSPEQLQRLDEISAVPLGYPHELLAAREQRDTMTGGRWHQIDFPARVVA